MKTIFYVGRKMSDNGYHLMHKLQCVDLPPMNERFYLGAFEHCHDALELAKNIFPRVCCCDTCCKPCPRNQ